MPLWDRIGRSLFVALAVGLGWGIRGDFGHLVGAMYPGAALGLALAYVSGQRSLFVWMPVVASLSALGIGSGGRMSYGILHGYAQSDTWLNLGYGFLTLFLQGSAWGTFGGALIGLMLERKPMRTSDWLGLLGTIFMTGWLGSFLLVTVLGFHINPPRNDDSIMFMCAAIGQFVWLATHDKPTGLKGAFFGYIGFGLGMAAGRLLGNTANVLQTGTMTINHWNVMEVSCGFVGGFVYCFGMVNQTYPEPDEPEALRLPSIYGVLYVLGLIPLWHRVTRIPEEKKLAEWSQALGSYGYRDPDSLSRMVLHLLDGVCVLGFVGSAVWLWIHRTGRQRWAALPVLWLSVTMLLFQNLNALYFFYPSKTNQINMHNIFWILFTLMLIYVAIARPQPTARAIEGSDPGTWRWARWTIGALVAWVLVVVLAGTLVNGDRTMRSANTRWPIWSWSEGPFPGR